MQGEGAPTPAARVGEEKRAREDQGKEEKEEEEEAHPKEEKRLREEPGNEGAQPNGDADGWDAEAIKTMAGGGFGAVTSLGGGAAPSPSSSLPPPRFGVSVAAAQQQSQQQQQTQSFGAAPALTFGAAAAPAFGAAAGPAPALAFGAGAPAGGIGFRTGGAQDVKNFRENVKSGYLPLPSDVSFEGICKDYYFSMEPTDREGEGRGSDNDGEEEQQAQDRCTDLFYPTYSLALAPDPILAAAATAGMADTAAAHTAPAAAPPPAAQAAAPAAAATAEAGAASGAAAAGAAPGSPAAAAPGLPPDMFLSVGLGSGLEEFKRPRLNLVVLLDISGSMDAPFDAYYYDFATGKRQELSPADKWRRKMDVAKECLLGVLDLLREDDSVSVVLFNNKACVAKRMGPMRTARLDEIRAGIKALAAFGGTNLQLGIETAAEQLREYSGFQRADPVTTESRILLLTDAQPNMGLCGGEDLGRHLKACALDGIHATCVGVGLDFNSDLVAEIFKVKGANYFSVHSPGEFKQRLCDDFDMAVSPLVFDLSLRVEAASLQAGWKILDVYGSPNSEDTVLADDGVALMRVHTLFPSPKTEAGVKGGVVLLKVSPPESIAATSTGATARAVRPGIGEGVAEAPQPAADEEDNIAAEVAIGEGVAGTAQPAPLGLKVQYKDRAGRIFTSAAEVSLPAGWLAAGTGMAGRSSSGSSLQEAEGAVGGSGTAEEGGSGMREAGGSGDVQAGAEDAGAGKAQDRGGPAAAQQERKEEEGQQQMELKEEGKEEGAQQPSSFTPRFQSTGVRKAVALARYVGALQFWLKEEWDAPSQPSPSQPSPSTPQGFSHWAAFGKPSQGTSLFGQPPSSQSTSLFGQPPSSQGTSLFGQPPSSQSTSLFGQPPSSWPTFGGSFTSFGASGRGRGSSQERQSRKLCVGAAARERFAALLPFMRREAEEVDTELQQEVEVLERLIQVADESPAGQDGRPFRPTALYDDFSRDFRQMQHISAMPENATLSPEELRLEAYQETARGLWPPSSTPAFPPSATPDPPARPAISSWPPSAAAKPPTPQTFFSPQATFPPFVPPAPPAAPNSINIELSGDLEEVEIVVHPQGSVDVRVRDRASSFAFRGQHHFIPPGNRVRLRFRPTPGTASGPSPQLFGQAARPSQVPLFGAAGTGPGFGSQQASTPAFGLGATGVGFGAASASPAIPAFWGASTPAFGSGSGASPAEASPEFHPRANTAAASSGAPSFSAGSGPSLPASFAAFGSDGATKVAPVFGGSGGGSGSFGGGSAGPVTSCRPDSRQPDGPAPAPQQFGSSAAVSAPAFGVGSTGSGALGSSPPQGLFGSGPASAAAPCFGSTSSTAPGFGSSSAAGLFGFAPASSAGVGWGIPSTMPPVFGSLVASAAASGFGSVVSSPGKPSSSTAAPSFGTASSATPSFGAASSAAPGFGAASSAAPGFGAASSAALSFGAASTAPAGFDAASTAPAGFGAAG